MAAGGRESADVCDPLDLVRAQQFAEREGVSCRVANGQNEAGRGAPHQHICTRFRGAVPRPPALLLLDTFDDPQVTLGAVAERAQGFLIAGAVVGGDRPGHTLEFDQHRPVALAKPIAM